MEEIYIKKSEKNNYLKKYFIRKKHQKFIKSNIILFILIISFRISCSNHEICFKLKGKGKQGIFLKKFWPNNAREIYLNNELYTNIILDGKFIYINTTKEYNIVVVKFSKLTTGRGMFQGLSNVTEIDLSKINAPFKDMGKFFEDCYSLIFINFTNIDTKENQNMGTMFKNCYNLVSLDLSYFNTTKVVHMDNMFFNCYSLTSLNLTIFDTQNVNQTDKMFENCTSLKSLDISNFDTSKITNMEDMFKNCISLTSLNLSNFNFNSINIKNYNIKRLHKHEAIEQMISNTTKNLVICINNDNITQELKNNISSKYCPTFDCSEIYYLKQKKLIEENDSCIASCNLTKYIYEYENKCYNTPQNIISETNCDIKDFFMEKCKNNFIYEIEIEYFKYNIIESIKNGNLSDLLYQVLMNDSNYIVKEGNEKYQISTLKNQMNIDSEITAINFSECENILKEKYNIEYDELIIFKLEHIIEGFKIPIIEYAIFSENGTYLNLDDCNNISSQYYIPVKINEDKLFIHNLSSDYYNDECNKYTSDNGTDMTIYDRKNDFNENHLSLCESNCTYKGYNSSSLKAECECKTKTYLLSTNDLYKDDLLIQIDNINKKVTNLNLVKCSGLISSVEDIKSNTGFFLLGVIIVFFIIVMILFCIKGYNSLENKIDEIISIKFKNKKRSNKKSKTAIHSQNKVIKITNNNNTNNNIIKIRNRKSHNKIKQIKKNENIITSKGSTTTNINNRKSNNKNLFYSINKKERDAFLKFTNDYELNHLTYKMAIKYDIREFCEYYFSLIRTKQIIFFSCFDFNDYNSNIIKKFIFFLSFALHYTINALFFTDDYNIKYQLPYCIYSTIISIFILRIMLETLVLTEKSVLEVKKQINKNLAIEKKKKVLKKAILKFSIFFALNFILLVAFWYYLTCFNALYENTQVDLIINTAISFGFSCVYPFLINIIPGFFRIDSLSSNQKKLKQKKKLNNNIIKESEYVYKLSQWLQIF